MAPIHQVSLRERGYFYEAVALEVVAVVVVEVFLKPNLKHSFLLKNPNFEKQGPTNRSSKIELEKNKSKNYSKNGFQNSTFEKSSTNKFQTCFSKIELGTSVAKHRTSKIEL